MKKKDSTGRVGLTKTTREPSSFAKGYLVLYNAAQVLGWSYLLFQIVTYYATGQYRDRTLWDVVYITTSIFQNAAVLEIAHAMFGLVKSGVAVTAVQVYSRVMIVCGVMWLIPAVADNHVGVTLMLICWSVTEIIRYSYYALGLLNMVPYFLLWCRYSFFVLLYPFGITGELLCQYTAQAYVSQHKTLSVELPNSLNMTFSYQYFLIFNMLAYIPVFPHLYMHMFSQRKKILGRSAENEKKKVKSN